MAPGDADGTDKPSWFTPRRLLCIFCVTNLMVYLDRGVIASNGVNGSPRTEALPEGSGIQGEFNLSNVQDGFLATAFLVGLLLASPVFSESCKHYSAFRLIAIGMGTWTLATAGCGLSWGFGSLIACRMLVGVGEASFVALASPFIDDYAPPAHKAQWFAVFYLCIPVGFAAGYVYGGLVAAGLGWRAAFLIESAVMVPFVIFASVSKPLHLTGSREVGPDPLAPHSPGDAMKELGRDLKDIASHTVWRHMCAAYTLYTAVLGVYAFWGPKAGRRIFQMDGETADLVFGGVTVVTGIFGTLAGGTLLDYLGSTLRNANLICAISNWCGLVLVLAGFLAAKSFTVFMVVFAIGEFVLFFMQSPVGAIGMWSVPPALRPLAISATTMAIHIGGDVPSPPLVGALQSALEAGKTPEEADQMWRVSVSIVSLLLVFSGAVFLRGAFVSEGAPDYRKQVEQHLPSSRRHSDEETNPLRAGPDSAAAVTGSSSSSSGGGQGAPGGARKHHRRRSGGGGGSSGGGGGGFLAPEGLDKAPLLQTSTYSDVEAT